MLGNDKVYIMKSIQYLNNLKGSPADRLSQLEKEFAVSNKQGKYGEENLFILNYCQIDSPKYSPIAKECRGLVIQWLDNSFNLIAKSFDRFFNLGEDQSIKNKFNWNNFETQEKLDVSLLLVYKHNNQIRVNTRNTFGDGKVNMLNKTFEELFWSTVNEVNLDNYFCDHPDSTLVYELVSPYNKIVRSYPNTSAFLLTIFNKEKELTTGQVNDINNSYYLGDRPNTFKFSCQDEVTTYLEDMEDKTFEGFVLRDDSNIRIKVKKSSYLRLHRLKGNNPTLKSILEIVINNEQDEFISYFPEYHKLVNIIKQEKENKLKESLAIWDKLSSLKNKKDFAIALEKTECIFKNSLYGLYDKKLDLKSAFSPNKIKVPLLKWTEKHCSGLDCQ